MSGGAVVIEETATGWEMDPIRVHPANTGIESRVLKGALTDYSISTFQMGCPPSE